MAQDWQRSNSKSDIGVMMQKAKYSRKFSIAIIILASGTGVTQFTMTIILDSKTKSDGERPMYITSYFPYNTQITPIYEITWLGQSIGTALGALNYAAVDGFFSVLVMHLCGQLTILCRSLTELINNYDTTSHKEEFRRKIAAIVERHDSLNRFAMTIEKSFNVLFLAQMMASSIALCLQGYQLVLIITDFGDGLPVFQLIHMMYFTCCFSFSLFVYCYVAEELRGASTEIENVTYQTDWYNLHSKDMKLLLFLMHRSRKPLAITAGKFCEFSLELYCSILKSSGGYLSMLLAVRDRLNLNTG